MRGAEQHDNVDPKMMGCLSLCCSIEAIEGCENDVWRAIFKGREYGRWQDAVEPGKNST
jgi:hypothetical protein